MSRGTKDNITLEALSKLLHTSPGTIITVRKQMGVKKGSLILIKDIPVIKEKIIWIQKHSTKCKTEKKIYYQEALKVIERDGSIMKNELLDIFKTSKLSGVEAYFLHEENPIYDDEDESTDNNSSIFKLFNVQKEIWKEGNRTNGSFNNSCRGNSSKLF